MLLAKDKEVVPDIMSGQTALEKIQEYRDDIVRNRPAMDRTKFEVMEGMQNEEKNRFFTEFIDDNDVLRMNTIEAYVTIAPLIIRKCSPSTKKRIEELMEKVYVGHVKTHKINMVSKHREREHSYTKILSHDTTEEVVPTGIKKFFGFGRNGKS